MKFVLKQEKLNYMLEKLSVGDMFPSCVLSTKDGKVFSIQREESGRSLRMARFNENFFEEIDKNGIESIEIDVKKYLATVKRIPPGMILTVETKGNKVSISGSYKDGRPETSLLTYRTPEGEVMSKLTFEIENGIPLVGKEKIPLDTSIEINIADFKEISERSSAIKTEFYKFTIENNMLLVRVGDLHDTSDSTTFGPKSTIRKGEELETIFTYGIPEISKTFDSTVFINTRTKSPAWFYESSKEHILGVFIPPYSGNEE
jgi:DNA-directed RNA polymerase beta subunit